MLQLCRVSAEGRHTLHSASHQPSEQATVLWKLNPDANENKPLNMVKVTAGQFRSQASENFEINFILVILKRKFRD